MTEAQTSVLVLQDNAGNYFLVPQTVLERGRVAEEHNAEVERFIAESDVSGYMVAVTYTVLRTINRGVMAIGNVLEEAAANLLFEQLQGPSSGPGPAGQT